MSFFKESKTLPTTKVGTIEILFRINGMVTNRPFSSCCEPRYESKDKCKTFHVKISFIYIWMKTNFPSKSFALGLAFIMRFKAT